ncbi:MAG: hypothetical protein ACO1SV_15270 [Fimbriimonas sp.]
MVNDNPIYADPRLSSKEIARRLGDAAALERKQTGPLASLGDLGIQLTDEEEEDLRAYAERLGVNFDSAADYFAARHQIIPPRKLGPIASKHAEQGIVPVNYLHLLLKNMIYGEHCKGSDSAHKK